MQIFISLYGVLSLPVRPASLLSYQAEHVMGTLPASWLRLPWHWAQAAQVSRLGAGQAVEHPGLQDALKRAPQHSFASSNKPVPGMEDVQDETHN